MLPQAYYAMGSRIGRVFVLNGSTAWEVYYARYIDWCITTPLLLTHLIIFAGLTWQQWVFVLLSDFGMIVTGLIGNLVRDTTRWGWFVFGCFFQGAQLSVAPTACSDTVCGCVCVCASTEVVLHVRTCTCKGLENVAHASTCSSHVMASADASQSRLVPRLAVQHATMLHASNCVLPSKAAFALQ